MQSTNNISHTWGAQILTNEQLIKLSSNRLLGLYRQTRRFYYVGYEDGLTHEQVILYMARIKNELQTRPHVKRHDTPRKKFRNGHKQKLVKRNYYK